MLLLSHKQTREEQTMKTLQSLQNTGFHYGLSTIIALAVYALTVWGTMGILTYAHPIVIISVNTALIAANLVTLVGIHDLLKRFFS